MSKTQLTKNIEKALATYAPARLDGFELNYHRKQYIEYEVPVLHSHINNGLVDAVWLAEGFNKHKEKYHCSAPWHLQYSSRLGRKHSCGMSCEQLKSIAPNAYVPCDKECFYRKKLTDKQETVAVICFEIKISIADFKSKNGHNFIGNLNYYVMPYELYKNVKELIPANIGVITYHGKDDNIIGRLRHTKNCVYQENVDQELYNSLLHTFLNKKDKQLTKSSKIFRSLQDKMYRRACKVIDNLVDNIRLEYENKSCYNIGFDYCMNDNGDSECQTCPCSYRYKQKLYDEVYQKGQEDDQYNLL